MPERFTGCPAASLPAMPTPAGVNVAGATGPLNEMTSVVRPERRGSLKVPSSGIVRSASPTPRSCVPAEPQEVIVGRVVSAIRPTRPPLPRSR